MKGLDPNKISFMVGALLAFFHAVWAMLVAFGFAQALLNWVFWLHFIKNPYMLDSFDLTRALMLVAFTFGVGYVVGWIVTYCWNTLHVDHRKTK